ncbi:hypothetical protein [Streptomyces pseudovenezuelae]|uniref:Uncharacterized protein n=1 Tax=Streptomyces pseudovenezuelae TaxID=67350 RepID=A0A117PP87_9ACTN|nr:hypothetical protein [Streptomyces pseudovenezuelae]KUM84248.1 hypothetical protein AQI94_32100 [Streptomyces pseudovenezuelae]
MSFPPHDFGHRAPSPGAVRARDRGVKRVHSLTRWIAAAALAGTAALGAVYTHLLPGSSTPSTPAGPVVHEPAPASSTTSDATTGDDSGSHEGDDDDGAAPRTTQPALQAPAQPPTPTQQQPQSTTGAS